MESRPTSMLEGMMNIMECCICTEMFTDPRILPCIHTFCLKCIQKIGAESDASPSSELSCPICRKKFDVPSDGIAGLQKNFFMERLIEVFKISQPGEMESPCDICSGNVAKMYCMDCREKLCESCLNIHSRQRMAQNHTVVSFGSQTEELRKMFAVSNCEVHSQEEIKMYCRKCKTVICLVCTAESHKTHSCFSVVSEANEFSNRIKIESKNVAQFSKQSGAIKERLKKSISAFESDIKRVGEAILTRRDELRDLLDKNCNSLLEELTTVQARFTKELKTETDEIDRHLVKLESFEMYCSKLCSEGSPSHICQQANFIDSRTRELELHHGSFIQRETPSVKVSFISSLVEELKSTKTDNLIGEIRVAVNMAVDQKNKMIGVAMVEDSIYALRLPFQNRPSSVRIYRNDGLPTFQAENQLKKIGNPWDVAASEKEKCLYVTDKNSICVWKIKTGNGELGPTQWLKNIDNPCTLSVSRNGNVLILLGRHSPPSLEVYTKDAAKINSIILPFEIEYPLHAVENSRGNFIISHVRRSFARVCEPMGISEVSIGEKPAISGHVVRFFSPENDWQRLNNPCHLAIDQHDRIYVADEGNHRVILLDSQLKWIRIVLMNDFGQVVKLSHDVDSWFQSPTRLQYDPEKRQLLLRHSGGITLCHLKIKF